MHLGYLQCFFIFVLKLNVDFICIGVFEVTRVPMRFYKEKAQKRENRNELFYKYNCSFKQAKWGMFEF